MDFTFSDEQRELRSIVRKFLAVKSSEAEVRRLMATPEGYDPAVWGQMSEQLGLQAMAIPVEHGGAGYGYIELGIIFEEMGSALLCAPYFACVALAAEVLLRSGDQEAKKEFLPGLASGQTIGTLALLEQSAGWGLADIATSARRTPDGWTLNGRKRFVLDGHVANLVLVAARTEAGLSIFAVDSTAPGLTVTSVETMDQTRKQAELEFCDTPARLVGVDGSGAATLEQALNTAAILLAAEQVGGAARALDMAVEYAKIRVQFGRPIGSFQAVKHKCADMLAETESARSAAYYGLWALAADDEDIPLAARIAKIYCSQAYLHVAADNIQVHGGIGFTWEHPAHLYFKRAKTCEVLLGTPAHHRELLAGRLGL
jgi:alkylation response protein AidB-like acyl-CoA dehydrogenase